MSLGAPKSPFFHKIWPKIVKFWDGRAYILWSLLNKEGGFICHIRHFSEAIKKCEILQK
jgi:hypothetical protein